MDDYPVDPSGHHVVPCRENRGRPDAEKGWVGTEAEAKVHSPWEDPESLGGRGRVNSPEASAGRREAARCPTDLGLLPVEPK